MSPKTPTYPEIAVHTETIKSTGKKLKVTWSPIPPSITLRPDSRPKTVEQSNELFLLSFAFNEKFPKGSLVHVDEGRFLRILGQDTTLRPVKVESEAVVLLRTGRVGFLCSQSTDEEDFYFIDDLMEYADLVRGLTK